MSDIVIAGSPGNLVGQTVTIANGTAASEMIATQGMALVAIKIPGTWTAASLGYKVGFDGNASSLKQVYSAGGNPATTTVVADTWIAFPSGDALYGPFLQILSVLAADGTTAVNQGGARELILLFRKLFS